MANKVAFGFCCLMLVFYLSFQPRELFADEKIIQKEKMSFQKCLKVIEVSAEKLSIQPEISDSGNEKRIATFNLLDGNF